LYACVVSSSALLTGRELCDAGGQRGSVIIITVTVFGGVAAAWSQIIGAITVILGKKKKRSHSLPGTILITLSKTLPNGKIHVHVHARGLLSTKELIMWVFTLTILYIMIIR
jgi:hypothetical protein